MKFPSCILFAGLMLLVAQQSSAIGILKLSHTELRITLGEPQGELYAQNTGDTPLYLDVEQKLLLNPGHSPEDLRVIGEVQQPSLLVTPTRLILAPGQKYRMTLKILATPLRNQVWRITFRPKERLMVQTSAAGAQSAPLAVSVGYGVVVYHRAVKLDSQPE